VVLFASLTTACFSQLDTVQNVRIIQAVTSYYGVNIDTLDLDDADSLLYRTMFEIPSVGQVNSVVVHTASNQSFSSLITSDTLLFNDLSNPDKYLRRGKIFCVTAGKLATADYCFRILYLNNQLQASPARIKCTN